MREAFGHSVEHGDATLTEQLDCLFLRFLSDRNRSPQESPTLGRKTERLAAGIIYGDDHEGVAETCWPASMNTSICCPT
jgi:hypothetical protein